MHATPVDTLRPHFPFAFSRLHGLAEQIHERLRQMCWNRDFVLMRGPVTTCLELNPVTVCTRISVRRFCRDTI